MPHAFAAATTSRPGYIQDRTEAIDGATETMMDSYLRRLDDSTGAEIVVYIIPGFAGHGINKDGVEIRDGDMLANYIFNEVSLDGVTGIGKKGKDNGVPILLSLERDGSGGAMRIEIGRGLEGTITGGLAGEDWTATWYRRTRPMRRRATRRRLGPACTTRPGPSGTTLRLKAPGMQRESRTTCPGRVHDKVREEGQGEGQQQDHCGDFDFRRVPGAAVLLLYIDHKKKGKVMGILRIRDSLMPRRGFRVKGGKGGGSGNSSGGGRAKSNGGGAGR